MELTPAQQRLTNLQTLLDRVVGAAEEHWNSVGHMDEAEALIRDRARTASSLAIAMERIIKLKGQVDDRAVEGDIDLQEALQIARDYKRTEEMLQPYVDEFRAIGRDGNTLSSSTGNQGGD